MNSEYYVFILTLLKLLQWNLYNETGKEWNLYNETGKAWNLYNETGKEWYLYNETGKEWNLYNETGKEWNLYNGTGKSYLKHINFTIYLSRLLQNHLYFPIRERPPVLRDHKILWSLYTRFTVPPLPKGNELTHDIMLCQAVQFSLVKRQQHHNTVSNGSIW